MARAYSDGGCASALRFILHVLAGTDDLVRRVDLDKLVSVSAFVGVLVLRQLEILSSDNVIRSILREPQLAVSFPERCPLLTSAAAKEGVQGF